jgi:hypothetical protein
MTAGEALAAIRERAEAAVKGPWIKDPDDPAIVLRPDKGDGWDGIVISRVQRDDYGLVEEGTTEFISHARTDVPKLVEALEAVLAKHQKHPGGGQGYDADGNYVEFDEVCQACGQYDEYAVPWPCPTVTAVETALEGR